MKALKECDYHKCQQLVPHWDRKKKHSTPVYIAIKKEMIRIA